MRKIGEFRYNVGNLNTNRKSGRKEYKIILSPDLLTHAKICETEDEYTLFLN